RNLFERTLQPKSKAVNLGKLLILGAGQNGRLLAQRLLSDPLRDRELLGFIDDDPAKQNKKIQGLPVLGDHKDLERLIKQTGCSELIVAISQPPAELMRELVLLGRKLNISVQRVAHFDTARVRVGEALYRQVDLRDLLNRPSAEI